MKEKPILYLEEAAEQCFRTGKDSELFFDPKTGDLWKVSSHPKYANPDMSIDEAFDLEAENELIRLPKARDLQEIEFMDEYIDFVNDERLQRDLSGILRQSLPFQSYRNKLEYNGLLEDYYQYRNERGADTLAEWCENNDIEGHHLISASALSQEYYSRILDTKDAAKILKLMKSNPQFFDDVKSEPSLRLIQADLVRTPSFAGLNQKFYVGFFKNEELIAIADILLDYPEKQTVWIELIMVDGYEQNNGVGSSILKDIEAELARAGFAHIELGVRLRNYQGQQFVKKNGYSEKTKNTQAIVYEKTQELPEEEYEPEFDEPRSWTF